VPKVQVLPDEAIFAVNEDQDLLTVMRSSGLRVEGICNGRGTCGKCAIRVISGRLSEPTEKEKDWQLLLGKEMRLACQTRVLSDSVIFLPETSRTSVAKILVSGKVAQVSVSPRTVARTVRLGAPTLADQTSDVERLLKQAGLDSYDPALLRELPGVLRRSDWRVRVVARDGRLVDVLPEKSGRRVLGVAADIGTTTVVAYLYDLSASELLAVKADYNEQIKHGEDIVTRMSYALEKETGPSELQQAIVETLNGLMSSAAAEVGASELDIYEVAVAGNTVMTCLLLGADPTAIARAPYAAPFSGPVEVKAGDIGLSVNRSGIVRSLPVISGYVGGDVVGDILVSGMHRSDSLSVLVDLGTNGEVVIGSAKGMVTASCAAGPALEGYGITRGMRAMDGAIESVAIDPSNGKFFFSTIGGIKARGICGSGLVDAVVAMLISGALEPSGKLVSGFSDRIIRSGDELAFVIAEGGESADGKPLVLTQGDVRRFQLAKAAIYAATSVLMSEVGVTADKIERLYVAGAFANYISPANAMLVGLLPEVPIERVTQIGNGSGMGACALLRNKEAWKEALTIARSARAVELNLVPHFQKEYVDATFLPHKRVDLFPKSRAAVLSMAGA